MHRSGSGGSDFTGDSGVSVDDSNLVAYWKFDEGEGYVIKDATGHGHDLHATSIPHWQVCHMLCFFLLQSSRPCINQRILGSELACILQGLFTGSTGFVCRQEGIVSVVMQSLRLLDSASEGASKGQMSHVIYPNMP